MALCPFLTFIIAVISGSKQARCAVADLVSMIIIMVASTKQSGTTGTYLFARGIIVVGASKETRAAFPNFMPLGIVMVGSAKQPFTAASVFRHGATSSILIQFFNGILDLGNLILQSFDIFFPSFVLIGAVIVWLVCLQNSQLLL